MSYPEYKVGEEVQIFARPKGIIIEVNNLIKVRFDNGSIMEFDPYWLLENSK